MAPEGTWRSHIQSSRSHSATTHRALAGSLTTEPNKSRNVALEYGRIEKAVTPLLRTTFFETMEMQSDVLQDGVLTVLRVDRFNRGRLDVINRPVAGPNAHSVSVDTTTGQATSIERISLTRAALEDM